MALLVLMHLNEKGQAVSALKYNSSRFCRGRCSPRSASRNSSTGSPSVCPLYVRSLLSPPFPPIPGNKKAHPPAPSGSKWMCYVIPIVHTMLLRQGVKKARLPTQSPLWVNRRTMFYSQILCEKAQKAPCFWNFLSLIVFSPIITAASAKMPAIVHSLLDIILSV